MVKHKKILEANFILFAGIGAGVSLTGALIAMIGAILSITIMPEIGAAISVIGLCIWLFSFIKMKINHKRNQQEKEN